MVITQPLSLNIKRAQVMPLQAGNYYTIEAVFAVWGDKVDVQKILDDIRSGLYLRLIEQEDKKEGTIDFGAEFILSQLARVLRLIDESKFDVAVTLFKLIEQIMPEYQDNTRVREIQETRNLVWDALAKRELL